MAEPSLQPEGGCFTHLLCDFFPCSFGVVKAPRDEDVLPKVWREHGGY